MRFTTRLLLIFLCLLPNLGYAEIYQYEDADGLYIISDEKIPNLKLIRVIKGVDSPSTSEEKPSSRPKTSSSREKKFELYRKKADEALAQSTANRDVPESFDERSNHFDDIIAEAAEEYDLPFAFIKAVIRVESGFRPEVISRAGAMGLMQLMPQTAALMKVQDAFNPRENIFGGTKYLRLLCNRYNGNINLILAAYNAGDGAVARYNGIPYPQTRDYVEKINHWFQYYSSNPIEAPP